MKSTGGSARSRVGYGLGWLCWLCLFAMAGYSVETTYQVRRGDTLSDIAKQFDVAPDEIAHANRLGNPDRLDVGQELTIPAHPRAARTYVVRKGDVLSTIARLHHVTVQQLVDANGLVSPDELRIGDELHIPAPRSDLPTLSLPDDLRSELYRIKVNPKRWRYIVIHHSATHDGTLEGLDRYHREERGMENGLAYHFVIGNGSGIADGRIEMTRRWRNQLDGGHMASSKLNRNCVGICLIGNFQTSHPTARQMDSLAALCDYLLRECRISKHRIRGHRQINTKPTLCPGKNFSLSEVLRRLPR